MNVVSAIRDTIPISQFNRGQAGQIFRYVHDTGAKVVMKNNVAEGVILSPEEYTQLIDELADAQLEIEALRRLSEIDETTELIPHSEVLRSLGLTESDLDEDIDIE